MLSDDVIYAILLVGSVPLGLLIKQSNSPAVKQRISVLAGCIILAITCRTDIYHSALTILVNCMIVRLFPGNRYLTLYSFIWCFGYLAFFRTCHWYGIERPRPHSNAAQLLLTLRLVSMAAEVTEHETLTRSLQEGDKNRLVFKYRSVDYSFNHLLSYSLCYIGLLTGPFYTLRSYQDMLRNRDSSKIPIKDHLIKTLKPLPLSAALFIFIGMNFKVEKMRDEVFLTQSTWLERYFLLLMCFIWFRVRFYSAWILSECMSITACLGAYDVRGENRSGAGPTDLIEYDKVENSKHHEYDFETIVNIKPYEIETATTIRTSIKLWNMTVQYWLAVNIYKKLLPGSNKLIRGICVMMVSGFWHGIHPGYYATFLSAPFLHLTEDSMYRGVRKRITSDTTKKIYDYIASFIRIRMFEYFAVGVFLLNIGDIWIFWSSLYFYGHFVLAAIMISGWVSNIFTKTKNESE